MGRGFRRRMVRLGLVSLAVLAGAAGVAYATGTLASIVGADGSIQGCYQKQNGQLRVVRAASDCRPSELAVSWSQEGPEGEQGEQGEPGEDGVSVTSAPVPAGNANCPTGGVALTSAGGTDYVCNGEQGPPGADGVDGEDGQDGVVGCELEQRIKSALPSFQLSAQCTQGGGGGDPPPNCDDGNPNTVDTFVVGTGCVHTPIGGGATEICDGLDNDGDGLTDEIPPRNVANGSIVCQNGVENLLCNTNFASGDNNRENGCEINLLTNPAHCGALGNAVFIPNGTGACVNGQPAIASCNAGFFNADGLVGNGCELREDIFEQNDFQATATFRSFGSLSANIAPLADDDWYRYEPNCGVFDFCNISFQVGGPVTIQVFENGVLVGTGSFVNIGPRVGTFTYHVRVFAPGFVTNYTLTAQT